MLVAKRIVIGAMLLAPLMTPVLALAVALVMAWPRRAARASLLVVAASVGSVLLAWAVALLMPHSHVVVPYELLSRTRPTLLDLVVALAAGAAGGYALVREEVGTSLPGVAVAVALLPPLAVAGASLELCRSDLALGQGCCTSSTLLRSCWRAASCFWLPASYQGCASYGSADRSC